MSTAPVFMIKMSTSDGSVVLHLDDELHQVCRFVRRPGGPPRQMLKEKVERRRGPGPLAMVGGLYSDKLFQGPLVTPLAAHGAGLPN